MPDVFDASKDVPSAGTNAAAEGIDQPPEPTPPRAEPAQPAPTSQSSAHPSASRPTTATHPLRPARSPDDYSEVIRQEAPSNNHLAAYMPKPEGFCFDNQAINEKILLVLRQHPFTQLGWIIAAIFLTLLPLFFSAVGILNFLPPTYRLAAGILWYLMVAGFVLESVLLWLFRVYIVTDERIIDVDFISLIYKNISTAKIDNIEDVAAVTSGFFSSVIDYGTVSVQTAAEKREFEFESVPHPDRVTRLLNELVLEEEREKLEGRVS